MPTVPNHRGFTILELMAAIAVLGILLGIGVPAFTQIIRDNRTANEANELIVSLNLARSEATKRGMPVAMCAAKTLTPADGCAGDTVTDWGKMGWLVFSDRTGTPGTIDSPDDEILQVFPAASSGMQLSSNDIGFVRFSAMGTRTNATDVIFSVKHEQCSGNNRREIAIIRTGRANLAKKSCT